MTTPASEICAKVEADSSSDIDLEDFMPAMIIPQLVMPAMIGHQHEHHDLMFGPFNFHVQSAWFRRFHADTDYSEHDSESESDDDSD